MIQNNSWKKPELNHSKTKIMHRQNYTYKQKLFNCNFRWYGSRVFSVLIYLIVDSY